MRSKSMTSFSRSLCSANDFRYSSWSYHLESIVGWFPCLRCLAFFSICFALRNIYLSFRSTMFWSSTGILLNDKARDWSKVAIGVLECWRTLRILQISLATAINDPDFRKGIAIRTWMFCRNSVWFMSTSNCCDLLLLTHVFKENCSLCWCFSNILISFVTLFCRRASCSFTGVASGFPVAVRFLLRFPRWSCFLCT